MHLIQQYTETEAVEASEFAGGRICNVCFVVGLNTVVITGRPKTRKYTDGETALKAQNKSDILSLSLPFCLSVSVSSSFCLSLCACLSVCLSLFSFLSV